VLKSTNLACIDSASTKRALSGSQASGAPLFQRSLSRCPGYHRLGGCIFDGCFFFLLFFLTTSARSSTEMEIRELH
jgi:hypothetical protein